MKTPPFGKPLKALLEANQLPDNSVYLYIGDHSWEKGKLSAYCRPTRTLILPPKHLPFDYEWPVHGCYILMIETSHVATEYIEDIVRELFKHGAIKVVLISTNLLSTTYKKGFLIMSDSRRPDKTFTKDDVNKIVDLYPNTNELEMVCIDDIEPENQPWLWNGIIPLDAFTLFAGVGGLGKSQLLMFIAARVSDGKPFKAGGVEYQLPQGSIIILSSEDSQKYALSPRLRALGADTKKIHKIKSVTSSKIQFKKRLMALDEDLQLLKQELTKLKEKNEAVKLIIIDPVINFIGKTRDYINTEVSNFLFGLTELAEEFNLAIILNKHLRKKDSASVGSAMDEISGSSAWGTTARQVWLICRDHEDKKKILFLDGKSNIKEQMTGMAFNIEPAEIINKNNQTIKTSRIKWLDETVTITPDEAVNEEKYEKSKGQLAVDFIINHLKERGQSVLKHIEESALKLGIKERTFNNAVSILRKDERIKITNGVYPNKCWQLKE